MRPSESAAALCGHLSSMAIGPFPDQRHKAASARQICTEPFHLPLVTLSISIPTLWYHAALLALSDLEGDAPKPLPYITWSMQRDTLTMSTGGTWAPCNHNGLIK